MRPVREKWSIAELLDRCSRRPADEEGWQEFVRRFHLVIKSNVVKTFRRKAREEPDRKPQFTEDQIEDLVQAVYARLLDDQNRALLRFIGEHENSIYQYLAMISVNVVLDYFREAKARKRPKISFSLDEMTETIGDSALPETAVARIDGHETCEDALVAREEIEAALKRAVTGKHRERDLLIFKLRHYEGLTLEEIKNMLELNLSPISVGSILNRIAVRLRKLLDPDKKRR